MAVPEPSPSLRDIWKWTLTKDAIAPCFVRDVLTMRDSGAKEADFFWLGYIPCRTVLLVAMVVGVQVYDSRTLYTGAFVTLMVLCSKPDLFFGSTVDDGTAVIDCILRHTAPRKSTATGSGKHPNHSPTKRSRVELNSPEISISEVPAPVTEPGYPVRVVGKVMRHYETRQIVAESIEPCISSLDEVTHWRRVARLHKSKYSCATPFVIPVQEPTPLSTDHTSVNEDTRLFLSNDVAGNHIQGLYTLPPPVCRPLQERSRNRENVIQYPYVHDHAIVKARVPSSPTSSSIASSTPSSPSKASSPAKGGADENLTNSRPRLRHPTRLHTRDLTHNTFRLYVKHYMDNVPLSEPRSHQELASYEHDGTELKTPTKKHLLVDEADVPTPRSRLLSVSAVSSSEATTLGFTLSHLRRVPELALLAERVVRAETRRREKAERASTKVGSEMHGSVRNGDGKSHISSSKHLDVRSTLSSDSGRVRAQTNTSHDPTHRKMKRLFQHAVVKLYEEGSIVLWGGQVRGLPFACSEAQRNGYEDEGSSGLWKIGNSTIFSSTSASVQFSSSASASLFSASHASYQPNYGGEDDTAYLSEPSPNEESYVPLTPTFLAPYVREAIKRIKRMRTSHEQWADSRKHSRGSRGRGGDNSSNTKGAAQGSRSAGCDLKDLSPAEITTYLRRSDGRWSRVGVWAVEEALDVLRNSSWTG